MTMSVPVRGSGVEKAAAVAEAMKLVGLKAKVATKGTTVFLTVADKGTETVVLAWDVEGAYRYDLSSAAGHKVRNAKAALKLVGAIAA
jgi:hypothetical protein